MIEADAIVLSELLVHALGLANRREIDDARAMRLSENAVECFVLDRVVHGPHDLESQVRSREPSHRHARIAHSELPDDVIANLRRRRGCERENWRAAEARRDRA